MKPNINEPAPRFSLPDQNGNLHNLSDYKGSRVLIYFYPKDNTAGCTKQACGIRDSHQEFDKLNCVVLGISKDTIPKHKKFADMFRLPFTLLADPDKIVCEKYGVLETKKFMGREYIGVSRTSFLLDENNVIIKIYENLKPENHSMQVLNDLKNL